MNILLVAIGSRGDIQPYVALGVAMVNSGHTVTVCASATFADSVRTHGLAYAHMGDGFIALMKSLEGRSGLERMGSISGALRTAANLMSQVGPLQQEMLMDVWRSVEQLRPDIIVFHPKLPGVADIADALDIPAIVAPLFPQVVPTATFPAVGFPDVPLGVAYRRFTYRIVEAVTNWISIGAIRAWRRDSGLGRRPNVLGLLQDQNGYQRLVLHGFSPVLCPPPDDWPATSVVTGHWPLPSDGRWKPPQALCEFLDAGPPPVYVGFGSMAGRNPKRLTALVVEALVHSGHRGVLATGWGGLESAALPKSVFSVEAVPHDWLFPRVSAVVHHGGAGTTVAGLLAGRPTVVCPFFADQPFWGARVHALGAGPRPIPQRGLTAMRLSEAITTAVNDPVMLKAALDVQRLLQDECGLQRAASEIERVYRSHRARKHQSSET